MRRTDKRVTPYRKAGARLKAEAQKHGYTNQAFADHIGYADGHTISLFYSGQRLINDRVYEKLAKEWGIRVPYLKGEDDWETEEDMLKAAKANDIQEYRLCKEYLETIGLQLEPFIGSTLTLNVIKKNYDELQNYLTDASLEELKQYDLSLNYHDLTMKYGFHKSVYVTWRRPFDLDLIVDFEKVGKDDSNIRSQSAYYLSGSIMKSSSDSRLGVGIDYVIGYRLYYRGEYICNRSIDFIQRFMKKLDAVCSNIIETFLLPTDTGSVLVNDSN